LISIIIPTLDEERALPATLDVALAQHGEFEVIVVDGGSIDATTAIVKERAAHDLRLRLLEIERGRAVQLNAGAENAIGEWLLFLHADTLLPDGGLERIASLPQTIRAGCFRHRFNGTGAMLRTLSWFHNQRFRVTRVAYGDQGLFMRRTTFEQAGGFPDMPIMEDYALVRALRRQGKIITVPEAALTSGRRWRQHGMFKVTAVNKLMILGYHLGVSLERLAAFYRK